MTTPRLAARPGRPSVVGLQASLERAREAHAGAMERVRAERAELDADVAFLTPRVNAFAAVALELGPEWVQVAWALQHRLVRMGRRARGGAL